MSSLNLMSEGDSFQGLWDGLDSLSLGILFGYLQTCSYLENFIMSLRTASPGTRALEAPGTRSPPPFLFQPPNSAGLSNWGLSSRVAEKSKW